jgi:hypothetical protein
MLQNRIPGGYSDGEDGSTIWGKPSGWDESHNWQTQPPSRSRLPPRARYAADPGADASDDSPRLRHLIQLRRGGPGAAGEPAEPQGPGAPGPGPWGASARKGLDSSKSSGQLPVRLVNQFVKRPEEFRVQVPAAHAVKPAGVP